MTQIEPKGTITAEMEYVAQRENVQPEFVGLKWHAADGDSPTASTSACPMMAIDQGPLQDQCKIGNSR